MERMYWAVIETLNKSDDERLYQMFSERLKAVVDDSNGIGWGFYDGLCDSYYSLKWVGE